MRWGLILLLLGCNAAVSGVRDSGTDQLSDTSLDRTTDSNQTVDAASDRASDRSDVYPQPSCMGASSPIMYISTGTPINNAFPLVRLNVDTRESLIVGQTVIPQSDIAYHISGMLIGTAGALFWIDPTSGAETQFTRMPMFNGEAVNTGNSMVAAIDGQIYFNQAVGADSRILRWFPDSTEPVLEVAYIPGRQGLGDLLFSDGNLYFAVAGTEPELIEILLPSGAIRTIGTLPGGTYGIGNRSDGRAYAAVGTELFDLNLETAATTSPRPISNTPLISLGLAMQEEGCASIPIN